MTAATAKTDAILQARNLMHLAAFFSNEEEAKFLRKAARTILAEAGIDPDRAEELRDPDLERKRRELRERDNREGRDDCWGMSPERRALKNNEEVWA